MHQAPVSTALSSTWYYNDGSRVVGPFDFETLGTLRRAEIITDETPVQSSTGGEWVAFAKLQSDESGETPPPIPPCVSIQPPLLTSDNLADCKPIDERSKPELAIQPAPLQNSNLWRRARIILGIIACVIALLIIWNLESISWSGLVVTLSLLSRLIYSLIKEKR